MPGRSRAFNHAPIKTLNGFFFQIYQPKRVGLGLIDNVKLCHASNLSMKENHIATVR